MAVSPRRGLPGLLAAFLLGTVFGAVSLGTLRPALALPQDPYIPLQVLTEVLGYVQQRYVDEVSTRTVLYDAVEGMVGALDEHSRFLNPEQYRALREDTEGRYYGVGISIRTEGEVVKIQRPLPGSPAEKAGLRPGDRILAVDGMAATGETQDVAVAAIKGPRGTTVILRIAREEWPEPKDITLIRAQIHTPSVESAPLPGNLGWVKLSQFQERTADEMRRALADLERKGKLRGLVLDLRDDPGGLVDQAVQVADEFLEEGLIVTTRGRAIPTEEEKAMKAGTRGSLPMVVLVNGNSASASEIVAGALQDHHRAKVMGTTSYGKGSVQTVFEMSDGSALKLTIARYYTPSGRSIHGVGIAPDLWVDEGTLAVSEGEDGLLTDQQLREAVRYLKHPEGYVPPPRKPTAEEGSASPPAPTR